VVSNFNVVPPSWHGCLKNQNCSESPKIPRQRLSKTSN
jgi:hypothetical protein